MTTPTSPDSLTGLKLWLEAQSSSVTLAGSAVTAWADLSGLGNNATTQGASQQGVFVADAGDGRSAIRFSGDDNGFDALYNVVDSVGPCSIIVCAAPAATSDGYWTGEVPVSLGHDVNPQYVAPSLDPNFDHAAELHASAAGVEVDPQATRANIGSGEFSAVLIRISGGVASMRVGLDSADVTLAVGGAATNVLVVGALYFAGARRGGFVGLIRHVIAYGRAITDDEWAGLHAWIERSPTSAAPAVSNVLPTPATAIARTDPVFFDVTDDLSSLRRTIVCARFADGSYEVVHDGDGFAVGYAALSTRTVIAGGWHYRVRRAAGWPSGPTIVPFAIDTDGNENA